jgi:hypothetical protein
MVNKLFIVKRGNDELFRSLTRTLAEELDVLVIYDRRHGKGRPLPGAPERRTPSDVEERLLADGFAVVRTTQTRSGNIRWSSPG